MIRLAVLLSAIVVVEISTLGLELTTTPEPAGTSRDRRAFGSEVREIIFNGGVLEHARRLARQGKIRHVEHQNAAVLPVAVLS